MNFFSKLEKTNYSRETTASASVTLVGLGALGSEIARLLGLLGVGKVTLVDNGLIEPANSMQNLFFRNSQAIGRSKAAVIAEMGNAYFPHTHWVPLQAEIADVGFTHLLDSSILFSATDSALARVETAYAACRLAIPMVDAGLLGSAYWRGRTSWFSPGPQNACYFCQLSENRRAEILALSHSATLNCLWMEENLDVPSTPVMASVIAGMAVDLAFRHGLPSAQDRSFTWEIALDSQPSIHTHKMAKSSTCPFHDFKNKVHLIALPVDLPFTESLRACGVRTIELDWPVALWAACTKCGHTWAPMRRVAWIRRHSTCENCGETQLRLQVIHRISVEDDAARYTPCNFSYTAEHLYTPVDQ